MFKQFKLYISAVLYQYDPIFLFCLRWFFCEIRSLLTASWSDRKAYYCFSPIASKSSTTVLIVAGTMIFLLSLVTWSCINRFIVMHLTIRLTSEENLWWKGRLSSRCFVLNSTTISFRSRQFSNSSITRAISGLQVSQRIRTEWSNLSSKSRAFPHSFLSLLFRSWIWSKSILENSR